MSTRDAVAVKLPAAVLERLRREALATGLPQLWVVAAFVAAMDD